MKYSFLVTFFLFRFDGALNVDLNEFQTNLVGPKTNYVLFLSCINVFALGSLLFGQTSVVRSVKVCMANDQESP